MIPSQFALRLALNEAASLAGLDVRVLDCAGLDVCCVREWPVRFKIGAMH
jgi:hypothetical protein